MSKVVQPPARETVSVECLCGKTHTVASVGHYDRFLLACGKPYWALRPRFNGPLELSPWPGPNLTTAEYIQRYGSDD